MCLDIDTLSREMYLVMCGGQVPSSRKCPRTAAVAPHSPCCPTGLWWCWPRAGPSSLHCHGGHSSVAAIMRVNCILHLADSRCRGDTAVTTKVVCWAAHVTVVTGHGSSPALTWASLLLPPLLRCAGVKVSKPTPSPVLLLPSLGRCRDHESALAAKPAASLLTSDN